VMRPDASVSTHDQPAALDALKSDSPLVQTVIGVLGSRSMLRQGADEAGVTLTPDYTVESVAEPGSTLIDSTVTGPDRAVVDKLAAGYGRAAPAYVSASYSAYVLERLSTAPGGNGTGPSDLQVVILALLVGTALGVALVAAELLLEPRLRGFRSRPTSARNARANEAEPATADGGPSGNGGQPPDTRPEPAVRFAPAPRPEPRSVPTVRSEPDVPRGLTTPTKPVPPRRPAVPPAPAPEADSPEEPRPAPERRVARPPSARQEANGRPERESRPKRAAAPSKRTEGPPPEDDG
jgi:hypothetical protein